MTVILFDKNYNRMEPLKQNIKDTYKISSTIGKGSYSSVKVAKHRDTGELFAVKVISKRKVGDDVMHQIMTEVEVLKQLDHPNIVKLFEVYEDDKHWWLVMELVQGGQLFEQVYLRESTSELEARRAIK